VRRFRCREGRTRAPARPWIKPTATPSAGKRRHLEAREPIPPGARSPRRIPPAAVPHAVGASRGRRRRPRPGLRAGRRRRGGRDSGRRRALPGRGRSGVGLRAPGQRGKDNARSGMRRPGKGGESGSTGGSSERARGRFAAVTHGVPILCHRLDYGLSTPERDTAGPGPGGSEAVTAPAASRTSFGSIALPRQVRLRLHGDQSSR